MITLAVLAVVYRCAALVVHSIDTDEFDHVNIAWHALQGHAYYPSKFGIIPQLYWELLEPTVLLFGERVETILVARGGSLAASLATLAALHHYGRVVHGPRLAWVAPLAFTFVIHAARTGVQVRPDVPQMLCYALALPLAVQARLDGPARRFTMLGLWLGLATLFKQTAFVLGLLLVIRLAWHERAALWPPWGRSMRLPVRAAALVLAPVLALWIAAAVQSGAPADFLRQTLIAVPHLHGEGENDYSGLLHGLGLNPLTVLVPGVFLAVVGARIAFRRPLHEPRVASLGLVMIAYVAVDAAAASNFGDAHFLQMALLVAVTGVYLAGWLHSVSKGWARLLIPGTLITMAANVLAVEPVLDARKESHEHLPQQLATVRFLLEHTPPGTPVLGSYPIWMFRPGGEHINPPELLEAFLISHDSTGLNVGRQELIDDFTSQPAVFVHMDGWMADVITAAPEIGTFIDREFGLFCYAPGAALLAVHEVRGEHVPRELLVPFDPRVGRCDTILKGWEGP